MVEFLTDGYQAPVGESRLFPRLIAPPPWHVSLQYAEFYMLLDRQASYHTGTDMSMEAGGGIGELVYAAASGVVVFAQDVTGSSWRNLLVIQHTHPDGQVRCSRYGHLLAFAPGIRPGLCVARGEPVGWVGDASGLFYPHLHFDIGRGDLLRRNPTHWPGANYQAVLDLYENPEQIIRNEFAMNATTDQVIILEPGQQVVVQAKPAVDPTPDPASTVVIVNGAGTRIRIGPSTTAGVKKVVDTGLELTVIDLQLVVDGYHWLKIVEGLYQGNYIAREVTRPKA